RGPQPFGAKQDSGHWHDLPCLRPWSSLRAPSTRSRPWRVPPVLRREQINAQVALANALMQTKGYVAAETRAALGNAQLVLDRAGKRGEPPEDPLILFSILYGFWSVSFQHFNREAVCNLAAQFLELADKQRASGPVMVGHRLLGASLSFAGDFLRARA